MTEFECYLEQAISGTSKLDELARDMLSAGGKRLRGKMTVHIARLMGLESRVALPWAAANELLHNASLIHDDIQDEDLWRRGRPTAWAAHGTGVAISLGDYMLMKPFLLIQQIPTGDYFRLKLSQWMAEAVEKMAIAQVQETELLQVQGGDELRRAYCEVARGKTASLFELPVAGLALLAQLDEKVREQWVSAFGTLGLVFQILDDLKDILGLKGKPLRGEDLREGKVSAFSVCFYELRPTEGALLLDSLSAKERERASEWIEKIERSGAIEATQKWLLQEWRQFEVQLPEAVRKTDFVAQIREWLDIDEALAWRNQ